MAGYLLQRCKKIIEWKFHFHPLTSRFSISDLTWSYMQGLSTLIALLRFARRPGNPSQPGAVRTKLYIMFRCLLSCYGQSHLNLITLSSFKIEVEEWCTSSPFHCFWKSLLRFICYQTSDSDGVYFDDFMLEAHDSIPWLTDDFEGIVGWGVRNRGETVNPKSGYRVTMMSLMKCLYY